jgi:hypothetical protein
MYHEEAVFIDKWAALLDGLPKGTVLDDAVRNKAEQGDPFAIKYLAWQNTPQVHIRDALCEAAHKAHPHFKQTPDGVLHWTGDGEMPSEAAIIDCFQLTNPAEPLRIEAEAAVAAGV